MGRNLVKRVLISLEDDVMNILDRQKILGCEVSCGVQSSEAETVAWNQRFEPYGRGVERSKVGCFCSSTNLVTLLFNVRTKYLSVYLFFSCFDGWLLYKMLRSEINFYFGNHGSVLYLRNVTPHWYSRRCLVGVATLYMVSKALSEYLWFSNSNMVSSISI